MGNTILVALDGSVGSKQALAAAVSHAKLADSDILLAYVIDWSPYSFHTPQELEERHSRRESEIARANDSVLTPEANALKEKGVVVKTVVRHGKIAETLNQICDENNVAQIYIGRLGESRMRSMIFGSVTAALIQSSSVPVTVVPG